MSINRQDIVDCYRYILGREPESESVVDEHFRIFGGGRLADLQKHFFSSAEYCGKKEVMISYAQNCEDVILWRALKDVNNGFYIDVGANDPVVHSVTKWFYDRGWRGVNLEPADAFFPRLQAMRPEDVNIKKGVGAKEEKLKFYEIPGTGLSTLEPEVAAFHRGKWQIVEHEIEIVTLTSVCEQYARGKEIHFLKIDVEEAEKKVLEGMNFERFRPWIVVIEVGGKTEIEWERLITDFGYRYTLYDGLNRYYVAEEKFSDLGKTCSRPAGSLDVYEKAEHRRLRLWHEELLGRYAELRDR